MADITGPPTKWYNKLLQFGIKIMRKKERKNQLWLTLFQVFIAMSGSSSSEEGGTDTNAHQEGEAPGEISLLVFLL